MISSASIINPKRGSQYSGFDGWYPYYAGYSSEFVSQLFVGCNLNKDSKVLDPWNGSGTSTTVANNLGISAKGFDLNPVMVLAAKSCLVSRHDYTSLNPIALQIIELSKSSSREISDEESLLTWFKTISAGKIRDIEIAIQTILFDQRTYKKLADHGDFVSVSSIAAFFYVAMFRTINKLVFSFKATNPTWIKLPQKPENRKHPAAATIHTTFLNEVKLMTEAVKVENVNSKQSQQVDVYIGDSCSLNLSDESIDFVLSSPPYCTRIDYAIATLPELTLLGFQPETSLDSLRRKLIGTSTVPSVSSIADKRWGTECNRFLESVYEHKSKASSTYYYKSHIQYYHSIFKSMIEIERVLKNDGTCVLVVQDSHYKDVYNNVPKIITEMAAGLGLGLVRQEHFSSTRHMAKLNPNVKKYRTRISAIESVLCFKK